MKFQAGQPRPENAGRKKGQPNHINKDIKNMIAEALDRAGGADYLLEQAQSNPTAFLGLIKTIVPRDVNLGGQEGNELTVKILGYKNGD